MRKFGLAILATFLFLLTVISSSWCVAEPIEDGHWLAFRPGLKMKIGITPLIPMVVLSRYDSGITRFSFPQI